MERIDQRILVFTIAVNGYDSLFRSCIETHREYCSAHHFDYFSLTQTPEPVTPAESAWLKIVIALEAISAGYRWVGFLDADCDVRSHAPHFAEMFADQFPEKQVFVAPGFSGRINSGVFFVRVAPESSRLFEEILRAADTVVPAEDSAPYENGHVIHYCKNNEITGLLAHDGWNNNSNLNPNSYIQHYTGPLRQWFMRNRAPLRFRIRSIYDNFRKKYFPRKRPEVLQTYAVLPSLLKMRVFVSEILKGSITC